MPVVRKVQVGRDGSAHMEQTVAQPPAHQWLKHVAQAQVGEHLTWSPRSLLSSEISAHICARPVSSRIPATTKMA